MNKTILYICSLSLILSTPTADAKYFDFSIPFEKIVKQALYTTTVGATALRYFTKKPLSKEELARVNPIEQEKSYLKLFMRIIDDVIIGQNGGKPDELESIDLKTGKATLRKFPATGFVGRGHELTKKFIIPIASCGIALDNFKTTVKTGINWYKNDIDKDDRK